MKAPNFRTAPTDHLPTMFSRQSTINGWGRSTPAHVFLEHPRSIQQLQGMLAGCPGPLTFRGAGRSYGDAAIGIHTIELSQRAAIRFLDAKAGIILADAGATLQAVHQLCIPQGWALPVLPGTSQITVGGAVASDVHGKNHRSQGSFSGHVVGLSIMLASGEVLQISSESHPEEFWATVGGMGLTGVILTATIALQRIQTSYLCVGRQKAGSLEEAMGILAAPAQESGHVVAWVDGTRRELRSLVETSTPATPQLLPPRLGAVPLMARGATVRNIRSLPGRGILNQRSISAANAVRWNLPLGSGTRPVDFGKALNPLDGADFWPAAFGGQGMLQYQFSLPPAGAPMLRVILEGLQRAGQAPALAVLKALGEAGNGLLSFPQPGWTLALDFPARAPGLGAVLDRLDHMVAEAGGRIYLAKDSRLSPEMMALMYPNLPRWQEIRSRMDPTRKLASNLSRRLNLVEGAS